MYINCQGLGIKFINKYNLFVVYYKQYWWRGEDLINVKRFKGYSQGDVICFQLIIGNFKAWVIINYITEMMQDSKNKRRIPNSYLYLTKLLTRYVFFKFIIITIFTKVLSKHIQQFFLVINFRSQKNSTAS